MPTISDLRSQRHSGARSAMSSLYRFAEATIVKSIAAEMKRPGGRGLASIQAPRLASFGLKHIRCQVKLVKSGQNCETKPIWKPAHYDLIQADRGQPLQCVQEHWAENGGWKASVTLQRHP